MEFFPDNNAEEYLSLYFRYFNTEDGYKVFLWNFIVQKQVYTLPKFGIPYYGLTVQ
jgi:hypothetical protein